MFTPQIKVQIGESTLIIKFLKGKTTTLSENKHLSVHFFPHGRRLFHLLTEKSTVQSVRNGHQGDNSRADTINKSINKRSKKFSIRAIQQIASEKIKDT